MDQAIIEDSFERQLLRSQSGRDIVQMDWAGTQLGPIKRWPAALKAQVLTVLSCPAPMIMGWGDELHAFFNDAYRPILASRADIAMGVPFRDLWRGVWSKIEPLIEATLAGESSSHVDMHVASGHGSLPDDGWWTFTSSPLHDESGAIRGLLSLAEETTERVLAVRKRQSAAERLRQAIAAGDRIGSWDWDVVNDRVYANAQFALMYCVDPVQAREGAPIDAYLSCIHPEDLSRVRTEIAEAQVSGAPYYSEYRMIGVGGIHWIAAQGKPELDEQGRCVRFPGLSFDISMSRKGAG